MPGHLAETVIDLYRRHAAQWDADRRSSPWNDRVWHETFIRELSRGSRVLDLGCGGAEPVARILVDHGMRVTGVDSSPAMIGKHHRSLTHRFMPRSPPMQCCVAIAMGSRGRDWVKKSYGYPVRCRSEPNISSMLYGSGVPIPDSCTAAEATPIRGPRQRSPAAHSARSTQALSPS